MKIQTIRYAVLAFFVLSSIYSHAATSTTYTVGSFWNAAIFSSAVNNTVQATTADGLYTCIIENGEWVNDGSFTGIRIKSGGTLTINVTSDKKITKVNIPGFEYSTGAKLTCGLTTNSGTTWTTSKTVSQVVFRVTGGTSEYVQLATSATITPSYETSSWITPAIHMSGYDFIQDLASKTFHNQPSIVIFGDQKEKTNLTSRFYINYSILGQTLSSNTTSTTDPVTGTTVTRLYGEVTLGDKAGDVQVLVSIIPLSSYNRIYNTTYSIYTIHIDPKKPVLTFPETINVNINQTINTPTVKIEDTTGEDIADYYDVSFTPVKGNVGLNISNGRMTFSKAGSDDVTVNVTPKDGIDENTFTSATGTIKMNVANTSTMLNTTAAFENSDWTVDTLDNQTAYGFDMALTDQTITLPMPIVKDVYGNEITNCFYFKYEIVNADGTGANCWSSDLRTWLSQTGATKPGQTHYKVTCIPNSELWRKFFNGNVYNGLYNQTVCYFNINQILRGPEIIITPSKINVTVGSEMNYQNIPTLSNNYNGATISGYYTFKIPDDGKITMSNLSPEKTTVENGVTWNEYRIPTWYSNWKMTFNQPSATDNLIIGFIPWDKTHYGYGTYRNLVTILDKVRPIMTLSDTQVVANVGNNVAEPKLSITNTKGKNLNSCFNLTYSIVNADGAAATINATTGEVTTGNSAGTATVTITATPNTDNKDFYYSGSITYNIELVKSDWTYQISNDGKLTFTNGGTMISGTSIGGVPGLTVKFGNSKGTAWDIKGTSGALYAESGSLAFTNKNKAKNIPTDGTFYMLKPVVNGFVTIDANYTDGNTVAIVSLDQDSTTIYNKYIGSGSREEHTFTYPLIVGNTYYLFNLGDGTSNEPLQLFGINYTPAWVVNRTDTKSYTENMAYLSSTTSSMMPYVLKVADSNVTFSSSKTNVATVTSENTITALKSGSSIITATVTSTENSNAVKSTAMTINVSSLPTCQIGESYTPAVNDTLYTTPRTNISMIFGGWEPGRGSYTGSDNRSYLDSWQASRIDAVGADGKAIDGFDYAVMSSNKAKDENTFINSGDYNPENQTSWDVPCRGGFLKFEPKANGTLSVYTLLNGCANYNGVESDLSTDESLKNVQWNAFYIVDESGKQVNDVTAETNGTYLCSKKEITYNWEGITPNDNKYNLITGTWGNKGETQSIIATNLGEYLVVSKAYVKFTFDVKAGKTYFIFSNTSSIGFCGYTFNEIIREGDPTVELNNSATEYTTPTATNVKISIPGYTFTKGQWNSICLPFSMQEGQFKKAFGDGARLVAFDDISNETTLNFTKHYYQMLIAGRPYLILPDKDINGLVVDSVSIENIDPSTYYVNSTDGTYTFKGTYAYETMPAFSLYMKTGQLFYSRNAVNMKGFRSYFRSTTADANELTSVGAKFAYGNGEWTDYDYYVYTQNQTTPTGIINIPYSEDVVTTTDEKVYNAQGQIVSTSSDVDGLSKGIYIINHKKIVVK